MLHSVCWVLVRVFEFLVFLGILPHRQTTLQISFQPSSCEQEEPLYESPLLFNLSNLYDYSLFFINDWFALCCLKYLCLLRFLWMEPEIIKQETEGAMRYFLCKIFTLIDSKKFSSTWTKYRSFRPFTHTADYLHWSILAIKRKKFQQITCTGR